jgi:hypothetical protein
MSSRTNSPCKIHCRLRAPPNSWAPARYGERRGNNIDKEDTRRQGVKTGGRKKNRERWEKKIQNNSQDEEIHKGYRNKEIERIKEKEQ